jgi:hypothetical protein
LHFKEETTSDGTAEVSKDALKKPKNHILSRFFDRLLVKKIKHVAVTVRMRKIRRQKVEHVKHDATLRNVNMLTKNFMDAITEELLKDLLHEFNLELKAHELESEYQQPIYETSEDVSQSLVATEKAEVIVQELSELCSH